MRTLLLLGGIVAVLIGGLWIGQGTGLVMWPVSSFMLQQMQWAYYGTAVLIVGLLMLLYSRHDR